MEFRLKKIAVPIKIEAEERERIREALGSAIKEYEDLRSTLYFSRYERTTKWKCLLMVFNKLWYGLNQLLDEGVKNGR